MSPDYGYETISISELAVKTTAVNEESGYHMFRILLDLTKQEMAAKGQDHDITTD